MATGGREASLQEDMKVICENGHSNDSRSENGCPKVIRVFKSSDSFRSQPNCIVAIDFRTHLSVSCIFDIRAFPDPSALEPVLLSLDNMSGKRIPSCFLFDRFGEIKSIGYQAKDQYATLAKTVRSDYAFFEHVKKEVQRNEDVDRDHKIQAMNGKQFFLIDVIAHVLCHLKEKILQIMCDSRLYTTTTKVTDIDWVITVPASWKAKGKRMMREAGYMAGLCDPCVTMQKLEEAAERVQPPPKKELNPEKLSLALESESAAMWCKKMILAAQVQKDVKNYLIVDCDGSTVNISTHGTIDIQELAPSACNMSDGITINERFREFLSDFVDDPGFARYFSECDDLKRLRRMSEINMIVYTLFEDQKQCFCVMDDIEDSFVVEFPISFVFHFGELMEMKAANLSHVQIEDDGSQMRLSHVKMAEFFNPTVDKVCKLICDHIRVNHLASVIDTICWIGDFGGCKYLRTQLQAAININSETIIRFCCPSEPQVAIVKGAPAVRYDSNVIPADVTYGIGCRAYFSEQHRRDYCIYDEDDHSKEWCNNLFSAIIERGDRIFANELFVLNFSPASRSQKTIQLTFYSAPHTDVWYTTESGVTEIAKMDVNIPGSGRDRNIEVILDVTHAEIHVCVRDKQSRKIHQLMTIVTEKHGVGSPLTQDSADALQKLLEGAQVNISHPIVAGTTTLEKVQQLLTQRALELEDMASNLRTRLRQINQCGTLANVVSSTGSGMSADQQPCLSNSVMEDVCLKTEVHDHDQHITSDKLSPAMEHVCIKKTVMSDQQLYTNTAADVTEGDTSQDVLTSYPHTIPSGAGGPRTVTIEELKEHTKVTDSQLDTEIEKRDMLDLADHFDTVDTYAVQLGQSPAEQSDVRIAQLANGTQIAMDKALRLWRQHNPGAATYRALVEMLLRMGKEALAFKVCQSAAAKKPVQRKTCDVQ